MTRARAVVVGVGVVVPEIVPGHETQVRVVDVDAGVEAAGASRPEDLCPEATGEWFCAPAASAGRDGARDDFEIGECTCRVTRLTPAPEASRGLTAAGPRALFCRFCPGDWLLCPCVRAAMALFYNKFSGENRRVTPPLKISGGFRA